MPDPPLVSCVMPTSGRRLFVPRAIGYFLRQTYENRELVILDDGPDSVEDLVPDDPRIRYERLAGRKRSIGAKRNLACEAARGDLILHWDDDDWMADGRVALQVAALLGEDADACGLDRLLFLDPGGPRAWEYRYTGPRRPWLAGGTLCYTREAWRRHPFPDLRAGEDTRFVWSRAVRRAIAIPDPSFYVALIHPGNTSPKRTRGKQWRTRPASRIREIMGEDWEFYARMGPAGAVASARPSSPAGTPAGLPATGPLPLYWFRTGTSRGNFGDLLSPVIVRALSGRPVRHARRGPKLLAVGSVLGMARPGDRVWGTGFIRPDERCDPAIRVSAVRGPLTRQRLLELGADCPETYGDPGLLLPRLRDVPRPTREGIGIIPHYVDKAAVGELARDPGLRIIDIMAGVDRVLDQIARCEILLSSSLHGCVIGDALGIPTAWVRISDRVAGGAFKFEDYYAGTRRDALAVDWRHGIDVDAGVEAALRSTPPDLDLAGLIRAFPFPGPGARRLQDTTPSRARDEDRERERVTITAPAAGPGATDPRRTGRLAVFSAGTEDYLPFMVTSLRSFSRHDQPGLDYYIVGHGFSRASRALMRRHGIEYLDLDLRDTFRREASDRYPSECFWIFKGPETFEQLGYDHSLSVDGDVWCSRPLDLEWLPEVRHLAGIDRGCTVRAFLSVLGGYGRLRTHFDISSAAENRRATQTGVLFYNNRALAEMGFFDRVVDVYRRSEAIGVRRGGDDSTLALLLAVHPDIHLHRLDDTWNAHRHLARRGSRPGAGAAGDAGLRRARIVHFVGSKPWATTPRPGHEAARLAQEWRGLWKEIDPGAARAPAAAGSYRRGTRRGSPRPYPVRCYWYRGRHPNLGDELGPYLVRKVAGLAPERRLLPRPSDPRRLRGPVLLSVGSILRLCAPNAVVWGSGIRDIDQAVRPARRFAAVRGPLTRRRLLQLGYHCPPLYGDPGLLMPRYYHPDVARRYDLGIIPHAIDFERLSRLYSGHRGVLIIDVRTTDIESVVRQLLSCSTTVSSALHGLVLSVAYGLPTRWLQVSRSITGDGSKYYDFFASLEPAVVDALDTASVGLTDDDAALEPYRPIELDGAAPSPRELIERTFHHEIALDLDRLLDACPVDGEGWKPAEP